MIKKAVATGVVHRVPADLRKVLISSPKALAAWEDITPLARNEWICWVISGKKAETRGIRIEKALSKLKGGMRRPAVFIVESAAPRSWLYFKLRNGTYSFFPSANQSMLRVANIITARRTNKRSEPKSNA